MDFSQFTEAGTSQFIVWTSTRMVEKNKTVYLLFQVACESCHGRTLNSKFVCLP